MTIQASDLLLLDTNVLINIVRGNELAGRIDAAVGLRQRAEQSLVSIISIGEAISLGIQLKWGEAKLQRLNELLGHLVAVDINSRPVLEAYARFDALQIRRGWNMTENDLWIAATASASGAVLITTDKDFDHLHEADELRRIWVDPRA